MKFKIKIFYCLLIVSLLAACKKNNEHCWQLYDALGNRMGVVCDKTEEEVSSRYGPFYDRSDAPAYCWTIQFPGNPALTYAENMTENMTEKMINMYYQPNTTKTKVPCGYCQKWISRQKDIYKPTGNLIYHTTKLEQYCGDTCTKIYVGRIILLRETADSLITVEFVQKL